MRFPLRRRDFYADNRRLRLPQVQVQPLLLARGHSLGSKPTEATFSPATDGGPPMVIATDRTRGLAAAIWPAYAVELEHKGERLGVRAAATERDIADARALLDSFHPDHSAVPGMFICVQSLDERDAGRDRLIAAAQIGEYYHTRFRQRAVFGRHLFGDRYDQLGRGAFIRAVPLAAGRRFAVCADRHGQGLGQLLAEQVLEVAANYRWPPARVVEVSRYMGERAFFEVCCGLKADFLTRSGYVPVARCEWMQEGKIDAAVANQLTARRVPGYYYADVSRRQRPPAVRRALDQS